MHHGKDLTGFSLMEAGSSLMLLSLLQVELAPDIKGVQFADLAITCCVVGFTALCPWQSSTFSSFTLSRNSSNSFFFFSGDGSATEIEPGILLLEGVPKVW